MIGDEYVLQIIFKSNKNQPDIYIKSDQVSVVRLSDRYLYCIDNDDIIHAYNLDDIHAYHVDTHKVKFLRGELWKDLQSVKLK